MDLLEAMRTNPSVREFRLDPVPDEVLLGAIDAARFGPQGGNRQPVRFVVVRDAEAKRKMRDWYLVPWNAYLRQLGESTERVDLGGKTLERAKHFADHMDEAPAIVVVCAELRSLHVTDGDLGRTSIVGGASVYPTVQNFLLALRAAGVGSTLTTLLCAYEPQVRELLGIPEDFVTACHVVVGYPARPFPEKLRRRPAEEIVFSERFGRRLAP